MPVQIRPFRRDDRDQLTQLVNAHVQAVVPGITVSTHRILRQLEGEPGEFIVDPWVVARHALVAEHRGRVTAAVYLLRYGDGTEVGEQYRGRGELRWLVCWPDAPYWPDATADGLVLCRTAVELLRRSGSQTISADGALPAPGVYGVPDQWPHVIELLTQAGFVPGDRRETVLLADLGLVAEIVPPLPDLVARRSLGSAGTRLTGWSRGAEVGYIDLEIRSADLGLLAGGPGWADIGNLWVDPDLRRRGVGQWLVGQASAWLRLGHVYRLLHYVAEGDHDELAFARAVGFRVLGSTTREFLAT